MRWIQKKKNKKQRREEGGKKLTQRAYNLLWPWEIEIWRLGDPIPEWLSDISQIEFIDGEGKMTLRTRPTNTGGYEIVGAGTSEAVTRLDSRSDYVFRVLKSASPTLPPDIFSPCTKWPKGKVGSISPTQLSLLYK